jgi:hypothetical protein
VIVSGGRDVGLVVGVASLKCGEWVLHLGAVVS